MSKRAKRALLACGGVVVAWFVLLVILDAVVAERTARGTERRLAESLQAEVSVGEADLGLVGGNLSLAKISARRNDTVGHLALDVAEVDCDLPALGMALFDRHCRDLAIRGLRLEVSTAALFKLHRPKHRPIEVQGMVIDDAILGFAPSALVPSLGRVEIRIDHAESGHTVLHTPVSWLLTLSDLRARITLPAGITLQLAVSGGKLTAAGSLFGSSPVTIPVQLPVGELPRDGQDELHALVNLGTHIAEELVTRRAQDWLERRLRL